MRPITTTSSLAPTAAVSFAQGSSSWHSPIPYLFGGLAAMLGLIAFALLILACSYWRLSAQLNTHEEENRSRSGEDKKQGDSVNKETVKPYEEKILVIMAGHQNPTYLATPVCTTKSSSLSLNDTVGNHNSLLNHHSEKTEMERHLHPLQSQQQ